MDITTLKNPYKSGACAECTHKQGDECVRLQYGQMITMKCSHIIVCNSYHRKYKAGGLQSG